MRELQEIQKAFTAHLRNPERVAIPIGLDKRRVGVYSELISNNLSSLLSDFFPITKSILNTQQWDHMVRDFFITHESKTPYFMKISGEFAEYLGQKQLLSEYPNFLPELVHYEWVELALYTMDEDHPEAIMKSSHLLDHPIALSSLAQPLAYKYPVQKIGPEWQPKKAKATLLLGLRDIDEKVRFFELEPLAFHLLNKIKETPGLVARDWLEEFIDQNSVANKSDFIKNGLSLLQSFNKLRVLTSV